MHAPTGQPPKPRFRGKLHGLAFLVSIPAGIALVVSGHTTVAWVGATVFALSLSAVYGTSAAYHLRAWSPKAERMMKHLDHSMIFVLIAGSYTPIALLALRPTWAVSMVSIAWAGAVVGIALTVTRLDRLHRTGMVLYLVLGWLPIVAAGELVRGLSVLELGLLIGGGVIYTAGAVMLAASWPRLRPATFGHHEVWHAMVVGGGACHYALILMLVRA
ncbi:MAG: PAQR family membrane homeostasis protein TrhA [Acidimicrobiia bacterium]